MGSPSAVLRERQLHMTNGFGVVKMKDSLSDYFIFSMKCEQRVRGVGG